MFCSLGGFAKILFKHLAIVLPQNTLQKCTRPEIVKVKLIQKSIWTHYLFFFFFICQLMAKSWEKIIGTGAFLHSKRQRPKTCEFAWKTTMSTNSWEKKMTCAIDWYFERNFRTLTKQKNKTDWKFISDFTFLSNSIDGDENEMETRPTTLFCSIKSRAKIKIFGMSCRRKSK